MLCVGPEDGYLVTSSRILKECQQRWVSVDRGVRRAWVSWDIILMTLDLAYHYVGLHERRQTVLCLHLENKSSQVLRTPWALYKSLAGIHEGQPTLYDTCPITMYLTRVERRPVNTG